MGQRQLDRPCGLVDENKETTLLFRRRGLPDYAMFSEGMRFWKARVAVEQGACVVLSLLLLLSPLACGRSWLRISDA